MWTMNLYRKATRLGLVAIVATTAACANDALTPTNSQKNAACNCDLAAISSLQISGATTVKQGETTQLKAVATLRDGTQADVTGAVSWSAGSPLVSVDANGVLTGMLPGLCDVTGTVNNVSGGLRVLVTTNGSGTSPSPGSGSTAVGLKIVGNVNLPDKSTSALKVIATMSDGKETDVTGSASLISNNPGIASVSANGLLSANAPGTCDLLALHQGLSATARVNVSAAGPSPSPSPSATCQSLDISGGLNVSLGKTSQVNVTANMSDGSKVDVTGSAALSSDKPGTCSVSPGGVLSALGLGTCNLTAVYQGVSKTVKVLVF